MRVLFAFLFLCAVSCEAYYDQNEVCTVQGFDDFCDASIKSVDELRVSHVAYSTAEQFRVINGEITVSEKSFPFTVVLDDQEEATVTTATFPFNHLDSLEYQCSFRMLRNGLGEICWERNNRRVYLRKKITLARSHGQQ